MKKSILFLAIAFCVSGCNKNELTTPVKPVSLSTEASGQSSTVVEDFTIAVIPDTQYYTSTQNGGTPAMFTSQIDWIKNNRVAENIVYVASVGDITDHGNTYASEWTNASTNGYYKLETPLTGLPNGIPYGTCVGNHDQTPNTGHPLTCSTSSYNGKFGKAHFTGRAYYGGNYSGTSNDSHYDLFTAGGINFIVIYTEYDSHGDDGANMNTWAYNLLGIYEDRKAIIVSHMMTNSSGAWGTTGSSYAQGQVLYDRIKSRNNVFMMLGGHFTGESVREDTYQNNTIRTYLTDYQGRTNGGNGYMRLMKFSVNNNTVSMKTYSPHLNVWETDANSQFTKPLFNNPIEPITPPAATLADGKYKITVRHSGLVLGVMSGSTVNVAQILQWPYIATALDQQWNLTKVGTSGYYRISNVNSGKDMLVSNTSYLNGKSIVQWPYSSSLPTHDEWAVVDLGTGYYRITSRLSGLSLDIAGASTANGAYLTQWGSTGATNQQFQMTPIP